VLNSLALSHTLPTLLGRSRPAAPPPPVAPATSEVPGIPRKVVYMPSCVTRMMGPSASDKETAAVHEKLMSLFAKAGYEVSFMHALQACEL
jgi:D-lactate dehydrogenase